MHRLCKEYFFSASCKTHGLIMALSRMGRSYNALGNLSRISCSGSVSFRKLQSEQNTVSRRNSFNCKYIANIRCHDQNNDLYFAYRLRKLRLDQYSNVPSVQFSTNVPKSKADESVEPEKQEGLSKKEALKKALMRYGPIILVFHISHSLVTLGIFYLLVKSGVDMLPFAKKLATTDTEQLQHVLYTSSTFVVAYTLYKLTAPIRIGITLVGFPYVLKVLRHFGYQRAPPPRPTKP